MDYERLVIQFNKTVIFGGDFLDGPKSCEFGHHLAADNDTWYITYNEENFNALSKLSKDAALQIFLFTTISGSIKQEESFDVRIKFIRDLQSKNELV